MDFFRGLTGASANPEDPPASVLAEWNKYSGTDIESQGASSSAAAPQQSTVSWLQTLLPPSNSSSATNTATASMATYGTTGRGEGWSSQSFSLRIPSGTNFVYFAAMVFGAFIFYTLAIFIFLPILIIAPSKFALSFTFGNVCTLGSMVMLSGWQAGLQHLLSRERLPFTGIYAGSMGATLYAAIFMHSYILSLVFSVVQVIALLYYVMSYFPGGTQGMKFALSMAGRAILSCFGSVTRSGG